MTEKYYSVDLKKISPEHYAKLTEICSSRSCMECPLFDLCPRYPLELIDTVYSLLFASNVNIQEKDIIDILDAAAN